MSFFRRLIFGSGSDATVDVDGPATKENVPQFPGEDLLATENEGHGFFITRLGDLLKDGRYKIIRKLGKGRCSNTFLVEDLQSTCLEDNCKGSVCGLYKCSKDSELEILQAAAKWTPEKHESLPIIILRDHFLQKGPHGMHHCLLTDPMCSDVHTFRNATPTGKLDVHIVKPIIAYTVKALQKLHSRDIIHTDVKAENVLFKFRTFPTSKVIEEVIAANPPEVDGTFEFNGVQYPILRSQPFLPQVPWNATPTESEFIEAVLSDFGAALWPDQPRPSGDIGTFELRAPENIVRAECGKEIDIWALGCMTYELLTGQTLFQPQPTHDLTADESLLLLQYSLTGETLCKEVVEQSRVKEKYFDSEGILMKSKSNPYSRQTIKQLLTQHKPELSELRIDAAAKFIGDCLRLNPQDRVKTDGLDLHQWLITAFMGGADENVNRDSQYRLALFRSLLAKDNSSW